MRKQSIQSMEKELMTNRLRIEKVTAQYGSEVMDMYFIPSSGDYAVFYVTEKSNPDWRVIFCKPEETDYHLFEKQISLDVKIKMIQKLNAIGVKNFDDHVLETQKITSDETRHELLSAAQTFYRLGLNVVTVSGKKNESNSQADAFWGKAPSCDWKHLTGDRQSQEDFDGLPFNDSYVVGVGLVTGHKDLIVIDIDNVKSDTFLPTVLNKLGLPINYSWVVSTGSQKGYHIYIHVEGLLAKYPDMAVMRLFPNQQWAEAVEKVEILLRLHAMLRRRS